MQRQARRGVVRQEANEPSLGEVVGDHEDRLHDDPCPVERGQSERLPVVDAQSPAHANRHPTSGPAEAPEARLGGVGEVEALVRREVARRLGPPVSGQVGRCCADNQLQRRQGASDQAEVGERAGPDSGVQLILEQIESAIPQHEVELHLRVKAQVFGNEARQERGAERK